MAYEEYKKSERILNGEGLTPFPRKNNARVSAYVDFGPPGIPNAPIGTLYFDKYTDKMWILNSEKKWVHMANYGEYKTTAAKDNKNIINCRNCGVRKMPPQINKVMTEKEFIRSGRGIPPEKGEVKRVNREIYYTVDTNQIVIKSDDNLIELAPGKAYDLPKSYNCRNCGAPVKGYKCEYCGTRY